MKIAGSSPAPASTWPGGLMAGHRDIEPDLMLYRVDVAFWVA